MSLRQPIPPMRRRRRSLNFLKKGKQNVRRGEGKEYLKELPDTSSDFSRFSRSFSNPAQLGGR